MNLRENWRIVLLAVFVLGSTVALFAPVTGGGAQGPTNLQYGLELSGGTQIRAPLVGVTATEVNFTQSQDIPELRTQLAADLNLTTGDVQFRTREGAVEVYSANVTAQQFQRALTENGFDVSEDQIRSGVTRQTREDVVAILDEKINRGGLTGGGARLSTAGTGEHFVVIEVPNANRSEVLNLVGDRGEVEIVAHFPVERNGTTTYRDITLLTNDDFAGIGTAQPPSRQQPQPFVPVTLAEEPAENFSSAMRQFGFTGPGVANCPTRQAVDSPETASGYCLYTKLDGRVVYSAQMSRGLARDIESGTWTRDPRFSMTTTNMTEARNLQINLNAGALPTRLDFDEGTSYFLQPSLAQEFKFFSLIAGLVAWLAVAGVVFFRYGSPRVAIPMLLTAVAEVFLLLGFAATVGLALDLSHIAGFIAVIGTGVDDLIIIADEILQEGKVATGRVFQSRFRKAFWVIGAAAATTIIAMSPLTVLALGDLTGFAIVTIVGVLLGVLVTRPAYGDVLRNLMLGEEGSAGDSEATAD
jgi:preprotein translocase subunit SecD